MLAAAGQESKAMNESVRGEAPCILRHAQMATGVEEAAALGPLRTSDIPGPIREVVSTCSPTLAEIWITYKHI